MENPHDHNDWFSKLVFAGGALAVFILVVLGCLIRFFPWRN